MKRIEKYQYAKIKEGAYLVYLNDKDNPDNSKQAEYKEIIHVKYEDNDIDKIVENTLEMPYDVELYNYIMDKNPTFDVMVAAAEKFNTSPEVIQAKVGEYIRNNTMNCIGEGLIDNKVILDLSKHYWAEKVKKETKTVDF